MIKRDRRVRKGFDTYKIAKIWKALSEEGGWLHIAEIARRTKINQVTVRWYLDNYFKNIIEEQKIAPTIKIRLVRLKQGVDFIAFVRALELIKSIKKS